MCEEYESYHHRTGGPVVRGQSSSSFVPSVIKTNVPLNDDDSAQKELLLQRWRKNWKVITTRQIEQILYGCRIPDHSWKRTVFHMTKATAEFSQFHAVACREYTLPREDEASQPKGWIRGNTKIGPVLEVITCYLHGKHGVEIRIKTVNKDNSHSWVRISHGLNKLVTNLNNKEQDDNEQETSEIQFEECALKFNAGDFAKPIKGQSKSTKTIFCRFIHKNYTYWGKNLDQCWTRKIFALWLSSVEETDPFSSSRMSTSRQWWSDWILENKRSSSESFHFLSSLVWRKIGRAVWQEEEDKRKDFSIVLILQEQFCTSELSKVIQDAVLLILLYRTMLLFRTVSSKTSIMSDVQSIYIPSSIQDWYQEDKFWAKDRQYFSACRSYGQRSQGSWHDRLASSASCTIHAQSMEETSKHCVFGRHQPCSEEKSEVLSDTIERHHSSPNISSLLYSESCSDGKLRSHIRESICVTSASTKDFLETSSDEGIGFRSCSTTRRRICSTSKKFSTNPTKPKSKSW